MVRRILFTAIGVVAAGLFFFGRDAASYVRTSVGWVKDGVRGNVPIEFEVERARGMLKDLTPDIRRNMELIAKEEVELERLEKQIRSQEGKLDQDKTRLMKIKVDLSSEKKVFQYSGRRYSVEQVKSDLAHRFQRYKTGEETLASLKQMQTARQNSVEAARQKLEGMLASKRQLEVELEHLEARMKMVDAAQTTCDFQFDDSRLGRLKEAMAELDARLNVAEKLVGADTKFRDEIPVDETPSKDIVSEVTSYFEHAGDVEDSSDVAKNVVSSESK